MRRVDYSQIVRGVAAMAGERGELSSTEENIAGQDWYALRDVLDLFLGEAWDRERWPEVMRCEERHLRRAWASDEAVTAGTERYYRGGYYQALQASTGQAPIDASDVLNASYWAENKLSYNGYLYDASTAYAQGDVIFYDVTGSYYQVHTAAAAGTLPTVTATWGVLTEFLPFIDYEQTLSGGTAATTIGTVYGVWDRDPRKVRNAREYAFELTDNGVQLPGVMPGSVWVEFRLRAPELTADAYVGANSYAVGDQIYYVAGGNFYTCLAAASAYQNPDDFPAKWERVEIPARFKRYLVQAGIEGWLEGDGQIEKAIAKASKAEAMLAREVLKLRGQEGQVRRPRVGTY